jgi:hypothetical protein
MSRVRLLVGTKKGAFILTADGSRKDWTISGPHFAGWEMYHLKGLRDDRRAGLCLCRLRRDVERDRARPSGGVLGRGPDPAVKHLPATANVRVELPSSLCRLANVGREITLEVSGPVTQLSVLDALEARCPMLRGTIRDPITNLRRSFIRFFACEEDLSHLAPAEPLPRAVADGSQPFLVIGAIAGG